MVLMVGSVAAQTRPDFSGRWVAVSPEAAAGQEQTVRQSEKTLTRAHDSSGGGHSFTYNFDGTEGRFDIHHAVTVANASWDGDKVVIVERTTYSDGRKRNAKFVWSLNTRGELVVDFTEQFDGQPATTMQIVSKRKG